MEPRAVPRVPLGAVSECGGRSPWVSGDVPGEAGEGAQGWRGAPGCPGGWSPGVLRPYLLPRSPPCRAPVVAGSSSTGFRLLLCFQPFRQLPRDEAEQRGQLAVGPQVLGLEGAPAERAGGAGPARAVLQDAAPAEAVAAVHEPHGLREELMAATAVQVQNALQPLQLDDGGHGRARGGGQRPPSFGFPGRLLRCRERHGSAPLCSLRCSRASLAGFGTPV